MTDTSTLPGGASTRGALSARPSRTNPGPPRRWIHFHTESAIINRQRILIDAPEEPPAPAQQHSLHQERYSDANCVSLSPWPSKLRPWPEGPQPWPFPGPPPPGAAVWIFRAAPVSWSRAG